MEPLNSNHAVGCGTAAHWNRRTFLKAAGASGLAWLTPVAEALAAKQERERHGQPPQSLILLWLAGGPSQLETFDPHPNSEIAYGTASIKTSAKTMEFAAGLPQTAEVADSLLVLRSVVSREGDHERALYNVKTGFRPDPSLVHPSIGAVMCHQMSKGTIEIPRHVSVLPGDNPGRGGYLGDQFDAFQLNDPRDPLPDMTHPVATDRMERRLADLAIVDQQFSLGRLKDLDQKRTSHRQTLERAVQMMNSDQLGAFDLKEVPDSVKSPFGNTPFGRGCLVAARLIEVGVRCVEVTLGGWDSHVANHDLQAGRNEILDPAFASLVRYLKERDLFDRTIVVCGGEFGRTPQLNPAGGRDHWPHGFSMALAGGGLPGGEVIGETDPDGGRIAFDDGITIADVHASLLKRFEIEPELELETPIGRPMKLSEGRVVF